MPEDPIAELVADLERDGKVSLAWAVRWAPGGEDALRAAWQASCDPEAMRSLVRRLGGDRAQRVLEALAGGPEIARDEIRVTIDRDWHGDSTLHYRATLTRPGETEPVTVSVSTTVLGRALRGASYARLRAHVDAEMLPLLDRTAFPAAYAQRIRDAVPCPTLTEIVAK